MTTIPPTSSRKYYSYTINDLQRHAAARGGQCLSEDYLESNLTKYHWKCGDCDNEWEATWNNVNHHGSWCPICRISIRENICRAAICELFPGETFDTDRTEIGMELDGYSPYYKLAFEHDGVQHAEFTPRFHATPADFEAQKERDARKDELCVAHGIRLIRIPGRKQLDMKDIRSFVHDAVTKVLTADERAQIPTEFDSTEEFMRSVQTSRRSANYIPDARVRVESRGGELLSDKCPARMWPLTVRCAEDHEFQTHYDNLVRGRWCPSCGQGEEVTEERVAEAITSLGHTFRGLRMREEPGTRRNAKNEAVEYTRKRWIVDYDCASGHEVRGQDWDNINAGKGCEQCRLAALAATRRLAPDTINARADKCGVVILGEYKNLGTPIQMSCIEEGHRFTSNLKTVELRHKATTDDDAVSRACPVCASSRNFSPVHLDQHWPIDADLTKTPLNWVCGNCGSQEVATYCGMSRRKYKCKCTK